MDERMMKFRVGVVAGVTLFIAGVLVLVFGNFSLEDYFGGYYSLDIEFPEAPGVTESTPVRKSGITIGRVTSVELEPNGKVLVTVAIKNKYKLRRDEMPRIAGGSLFGDSVIEFVPRPAGGVPADAVQPISFLQKKPKPEFIQPGEKIRGGVGLDPMTALTEMEETLSSVGRSLGSASDKFGLLADKVTQMLEQNKGQVTSFLDRAEKAMVSLDSMARDVGQLVKDPVMREKLNRSLDDIPKLMADATKTMRGARRHARHPPSHGAGHTEPAEPRTIH